jgi:import inner membrane translocase subunit TIM21
MFLNFYVHGSDASASSSTKEKGYFDAMVEWTQDKASSVSDMTVDESIAWTKSYGTHLWERSKSAFRYLSGAPVPLPPELPSAVRLEKERKTEREKSWWGFAGLFGGLRRNREKVTEQMEGRGKGWREGEVHAELIRVSPLFQDLD